VSFFDEKFVRRSCLVRSVSLLVLASVALTAQQEKVVPLQNWPTPLRWQRSPAERGTQSPAAPVTPELTLPGGVSTEPLSFVAMTPCRLADTRSGSGFPALGTGPVLPNVPVKLAVTSVTACGLPAAEFAQAYSFNVTVVNTFSDSGFLTVYPGPTQPTAAIIVWQTNIPFLSNAAIVAANPADGSVLVADGGNSQGVDIVIDVNGYFAAPTDPNANTAVGFGTLTSNTTGVDSTASGVNALQFNTTGNFNTATGGFALQNNTTGSANTASGTNALNGNTTGSNNTAMGSSALASNTTGGSNTVSGFQALNRNTTGLNNTATGVNAMENNTTGFSNTAVGFEALIGNVGGSFNIAIGFQAGQNLLMKHKIDIGNAGVISDDAVIRIGDVQTSAYIAGISGAGVSGDTVFVNGDGQLGIAVSSRRFKEQITGMGDTSSKLFQLRPVNFFYKPEYDGGSHRLQYGLIAEEVETIYPEMVSYDNDGRIMTVKYQMLAPMLLNEVQKQNAELHSQQEENRRLEEQNRKLEDRLAALEALFSGQTATPTSSR
jgi:hypothetical protein